MNNAATSTIKGFCYQFNKTLDEIFSLAENGIVIAEGLVEDIDVISDDQYRAIQCKYHDSHMGYADSLLYQPILEFMLSHYYYSNHGYKNIEYVLYIYYRNCQQDDINVNEEFIYKMLLSKNNELIIKYISRILDIDDPVILTFVEKTKRSADEKKAIIKYIIDNANRLPCKINAKEFIHKLKIFVGCSYENLCTKVKGKMNEYGMDVDDIEKLFYPYAFNRIAEVSHQSNISSRKIDRDNFIKEIKSNKRFLITKWTKLLQEKGKLLKYKRDELTPFMQIQTRKRYFLVEPINTEDSSLSCFIYDYLQFYRRKTLQSIPMFFINCVNDEYLNRMEKYLFDRGVCVNNGKIGNEIKEQKIFNLGNYNTNIKIALCKMEYKVVEMIINNPPDDLFIIGPNKEYSFFNLNIHRLDLCDYNELLYVLNIRKVV